MKKNMILAALLAVNLMVGAQTVITPYAPGVTSEGAAYYLPKTALNVSITVERVTYTPGELCQYADRYLRVSNVSDKSDMYYTLKGATLGTVGLPDEKKLYHISFDGNSIAPLVRLSETGILTAINADHDEQAKVVPVRGEEETKRSVVNPQSYMTEDMLLAGSKAKMAELVAKEIYSIRESRSLILRGQNEHMPKDGDALQIILDGLKEQEEALMQLFVGRINTEESTQTYQVIPEGNVAKIVVGRFSRKLGLLHQDDLAGAPIYIDIKSSNSVPKPAPVVEPVVPVEPVKKSKKSKKGEELNKSDGLVYNIPVRAEVKVYTNHTIMVEEMYVFGQFGNTETLSSELFAKKKTVKVKLDPVTGALLKVEE